MIDWPKSLEKGFKPGELKFFIMKSRCTGKSMMVQNMMRMRFNSSWSKWEKVWSWKPRVSSRSGKIIWGSIMMRENKYTINTSGIIIQRATPKEALKQQREEFKGILSRG